MLQISNRFFYYRVSTSVELGTTLTASFSYWLSNSIEAGQHFA